MVFTTIMTRGAARFFRFFLKNPSGFRHAPKRQLLPHFRNPTKMGRWLIKLLQKAQRLLLNKEAPCGDLGGSAWAALKL